MRKTVSAMEARRKFGELLDDVYRGDEVIIERNGKTMGVLISPGDYEAVARARTSATDLLAANDARNRDLTAGEAERIAVASARAVRRDMGGERKARGDAKQSA